MAGWTDGSTDGTTGTVTGGAMRGATAVGEERAARTVRVVSVVRSGERGCRGAG